MLSHPLPQAFATLCHDLVAAWPHQPIGDLTMVVAVSGGADSIALLRGLHFLWEERVHARKWATDETGQLGPAQLIVAHYNHQLRGDASDGDEHFVRSLSESLGLPFVVERFEEGSSEKDDLAAGATARVSEQALREARYQFLSRIAHRLGARYVVTAHHADDQVETVLHQIFRGSGLAGLTGMAPFRDLGTDVVLARPLLQTRQKILYQALGEIGQTWREDGSNGLDHWQRNWLRNQLLPQIRDRYPGADEAILRLARIQKDTHQFLQWRAKAFVRTHCQRIKHGWIIRHPRVSALPYGSNQMQASSARLSGEQAVDAEVFRSPNVEISRPMIQEALVQIWDAALWPRGMMGFREWSSLIALIEGEVASINLPGGVVASVAEDGSVVVKRGSGD